MTRKSFFCIICSLWFRLNVLTFPPPAAGELNHTEVKTFPQKFSNFSNLRHVFRHLCPIRGPFIALRQCRRRVNSTTPRSRFLQRLPNLQQCRRWSKHSDFVFKTTMGFSPTLYWLFKENLNASKPSIFSPIQMTWKRFDISPPWLGDAQNNTDLNVLTFWLGDA